MPGHIPPKERIKKWTVESPAGCWVWFGSICSDGYGKGNFRFGGKVESLAHRASYRLFVGDIPAGMELDHICRNRACVNPAHMDVVTHQENVRRGVRKKEDHWNWKKTHCKHGHPLSGDNVRLETYNGTEMRKCKACCARRQAEIRKAKLMKAVHNIEVRES